MLAGVLLASPLNTLAAAAFDIQPGTTVLEGEPISIQLIRLPKGKQVTVDAVRLLSFVTPQGKPMKVPYRSQAVFDAPDSGMLEIATVAPKQGDYQGADARGLFWSMRPVSDRQAQGLAWTLQPGEIALSASVGGRDIASTRIVLQRALPQVRVEPVKEFPGAVFACIPGGPPRPAVIVLGGSEGNASAANDMSPRLASRGFAVLGLPYHSPAWGPREFPELPGVFADIPVERLNAAFEWLHRRKDVDSSRVALYGVSKGAEFALIAASRFSWVKAVVAIVPSDVVWEGFGAGVEPGVSSSFSFEGKPLPFVPYKNADQEFARAADIRIRRIHDAGRAEHPAAAVTARIPVENFRGSLLLVGAHDDQVWASGMMALNIAERRAAVGLDTETLVFPEAGHLLSGTGFEPLGRFFAEPVNFGGTIEATAHAEGVAFPRTMAFLRRALDVE